MQRLLSRSGVTAGTTIVFYGYGAHLGFWLMHAHGHDRLRVMDGPRDRWSAAGHLWTTDVPAPAATQYTLAAARPGALASREAVEGLIGDPETVIVDVRAQAEYDGECFWPSGAAEPTGRAGRIPGAVHIPISLLRTEDGAFRSDADMRQVFDDHAIRPDQPVLFYCTIGNRASQAWFALRHVLGHEAASVYYGSWSEWGTDDRSPIEATPGTE
jgi:thiosulfate/3-mercaptopyruvate sulfurtransferase